MQIKFQPGQEYFYILYGEVQHSRLRFVSIDTDGVHYHFPPYNINEEKVFESKEEAEQYLERNEKEFLKNSIRETKLRIENTKRVLKINAKTLAEQEKKLACLKKELEMLKNDGKVDP